MSWLEHIALRVYGVLMQLLCPVVRLRLAKRAVNQPLLASQVQERFGRYDATLSGPVARGPWVWVHAVSLGETRAAGLLMGALRQAHPHIRFLLTHGSATGREEGARLLGKDDLQVWQPWDASATVQRFMDHFNPTLAIMIETEVWPHWVQACQSRGVPMCLVNARLSEKSFRSAQRLAWLAKPAYRGLSAVWAQTAEDAQRLKALGANIQGVLGNVKFDAQPNEAQAQLGQGARRGSDHAKVLLASSREGEEALFLESLLGLTLEARASVAFLVVPRHPERFEGVAERIQSLGFELVCRSHFETLGEFAQSLNEPQPHESRGRDGQGGGLVSQGRIYLGDSMGEMNFYYACANVAMMGASFKPLGGQNLIEAIANECPVVLGPHTFNFQDIASTALSAGVARSSPTMAQGLQTALQWAQSPQEWLLASESCADFIKAHQGASQALALALGVYLSNA